MHPPAVRMVRASVMLMAICELVRMSVIVTVTVIAKAVIVVMMTMLIVMVVRGYVRAERAWLQGRN